MLEYGPRGLIGVLTPQANTTVEPEFWIMAPPGVNLISGRLVSGAGAMNDRLVDYAERVEASLAQFGDAPLSSVAFCCTGSSYLIGAQREATWVERLEIAHRTPFLTAARAIVEALRLLGARRVALVSPYPDDLTASSVAYWSAADFEIVEVAAPTPSPDGFHPIYSIDGASVARAIDGLECSADAVLLLGTGMPTLGPILERASVGGPPVLSSNLCLAWLASRRALQSPADRGSLVDWIAGAPWANRLRARMAEEEIPLRLGAGAPIHFPQRGQKRSRK